jgi:hypothetical protein
MAEPFEADPKIAEIAAAYALDALNLANSDFGIELDWSDKSVEKVEEILGRLHDDMARSNPPEDAVWTFAKAFGGYVGEVMRKHHGGEWGMINLDGKSFPGIQQKGGQLCWPMGRAHKRIVNGPEDNIWHYYQMLIQPIADAPEPGDTQLPKKPWWRFW